MSFAPELLAAKSRGFFAGKVYPPDEGIKDYLNKIQNFNQAHVGDV